MQGSARPSLAPSRAPRGVPDWPSRQAAPWLAGAAAVRGPPILAAAVLIGTLAPTVGGAAQVPDSVSEWSLPASVLVVEAVAFGSGALARSETGARAVGGIQALSALTVLSIAFLDAESAPPKLAIPYGLGLLSLSWYNFSAAASAPRSERFWTNAIGVNVVVLLSGLSAALLQEHDFVTAGVTLRIAPGALLATISF